MSAPLDIPSRPEGGEPLHRFAHQAMACDWGLVIRGKDRGQAGHAARAVFDEVDRLEQELSRFIPHSDVARLNALPPGEWLPLGPDALDCLTLALRLNAETFGAFDPTLGVQVDAQRTAAASEQQTTGRPSATPQSSTSAAAPPPSATPGPPPPAPRSETPDPQTALAARFELDRARRRARRLTAAAMLDLGAIGKGYAVDCGVALLRAWGVQAALLHSGQSTVYALGPPPPAAAWSIGIRDPDQPARVLAYVPLRDAALSGSGVVIHGRHIIDPRSGVPAAGPRGAWTCAPGAAESDALSTAFMILAPEQVAACCRAGVERRAALLAGPGLEWVPA